MQDLILASSSPRRKELLENLQLSFKTVSSDVDENYDPNWTPDEIVMELASRKAKAVALNYPSSFVIGSDTIVVKDDQILGKPKHVKKLFQCYKVYQVKCIQFLQVLRLYRQRKKLYFMKKQM